MTDRTWVPITPILPPDWDEAAYDAVGVLPHGRDNILAGWNAGKPISGTNLVCTQLRHPALAKAFLQFNAHFFYASRLTARIREILILRIGWLRRSEYEYVAHITLARQAGLSDVEIERIERGPDATGWSPEDANLLRAVDQLKADAKITSDTMTALIAQGFDSQQLLELVFIVGCYETLAMAMSSFNVQLDAGGLDPAMRARMFADA